MPKYGVHHIVLADAMNGRRIDHRAADILKENCDMAMLGAIGPDLFFWAPDYAFVRTLKEIYKAIDGIVQAYNDVVQPINDLVDAAGEAINMVTPATGAISNAFLETVEVTTDRFRAVVATGALSTALGGINLLTDAAHVPSVLAGIFNEFRPPRQTNKTERGWYWFDMLHYRKTGDFARHLVESARYGTDRQRAYAYGYLSHIATDLTGHPYVNQIVGGPYRLHVQRHAIVENFIDTWVFDKRYGESVNQTLVGRLGLQDLVRLPLDIAGLLDGAFRATYPLKKTRPDFLTVDQIRETYENLHLVLGYMEELVIPYPTEPFADVGRILSEAFNDLIEPPPGPAPNPSAACSIGDILDFATTDKSRECYDSFFKQIEDYFEYLGRLMEWLLDTIRDLVDLLLAATMEIPLAVAMAILYEIQVALYAILQTIRSALALGGLVNPEPGDLTSSHGRNLTTTYQNCVPDLFDAYPVRMAPTVSPLVCPPRIILGRSSLEQPLTVPGFSQPGSADVTPWEFIRDAPFNQSAFLSYAQAGAQAGEHDTMSLHRQRLHVGNATDLTQWMISVASSEDETALHGNAVFADFDLDGDRGYFYRTWKGEILPDRVNIEDEEYPY
jgi:hypothetical protein